MSQALQAQASFSAMCEHLNTQVIGQEHVVLALALGLLTKGHVLLEGLPGTAKTRSVKALSDALCASFGRIQFTPDLLPSDVTGSESYHEHQGKAQLSFKKGPIFNELVLADEINRAPAKVQAALLEAMAERTVTVAGQTQSLPELFMVLATQNPVEQEGTYPLPEAQLDRFTLKVEVGYPSAESELEIVRLVRREALQDTPIDSVDSVLNLDSDLVVQARAQVNNIEVSELCERYLVNLVLATRESQIYSESSLSKWIELGASPRASIALDHCARAMAWLEGRDFVIPDDIRAVAKMVLGHRIALSYDALADGISTDDVLKELLNVVLIA